MCIKINLKYVLVIRLYSSDGRAEDCHLAAPGSIPASAQSNLCSLFVSFNSVSVSHSHK